MAEFYTVVTDAGREAVARAMQAGEKVDITHFAVGDGGGVSVQPSESQTQLVNECWRGLVATYKQEGTNIIIDTYIPSDEESFTAREMGIFTADGVLFAVCNTPEMRKVLPSEGAVGDFAFGMKIDVSNLDTSYIEIHTNPKLDFIKNSEKGVAGGVAELGEDGKLKAEQVSTSVTNHISSKQNPHGVNASQVGAYTKEETGNLINQSKIPVGTIIWFAGTNTPNGYLLCNGANISRTTYSQLYSVIGTTYGSGDGSSTFTLPNLIDKFIKGSATSGTVNEGTQIAGMQDYACELDISNPMSSYMQDIPYDYLTCGDNTRIQVRYYYRIQPPNMTLKPCIKY